MKFVTNRWPPCAYALGLFVLAACGCGGGNRNELDVVPATDKARTALEKALAAWKNGEKCGKLEGAAQGVEVVDKLWQSGAKLTAYEIVSSVDKPGPRWFAVKLTLADAAEPQTVHYAVLGVEPLWVFREEDFHKMSGV